MANNLTKLSDYVSYIRSTIHDSASDAYQISSDAVIQAYIRNAVKEFSKLWPRRSSADMPAVSQQYDYALSNLTNWVNGFSWIKSVEYPQGDQSPAYYKADRYMIYNQTHLRFLDGTPNDTSTIRVVYYSPHVVSSAASSVPEYFEYSVANYAAALALESLAAKYAKAQNADIQADVVSYGTKSDLFRRLATELKESALAEWGAGDTEAAASTPVWNFYDSDYGDYTEHRDY